MHRWTWLPLGPMAEGADDGSKPNQAIASFSGIWSFFYIINWDHGQWVSYLGGATWMQNDSPQVLDCTGVSQSPTWIANLLHRQDGWMDRCQIIFGGEIHARNILFNHLADVTSKFYFNKKRFFVSVIQNDPMTINNFVSVFTISMFKSYKNYTGKSM